MKDVFSKCSTSEKSVIDFCRKVCLIAEKCFSLSTRRRSAGFDLEWKVLRLVKCEFRLEFCFANLECRVKWYLGRECKDSTL